MGYGKRTPVPYLRPRRACPQRACAPVPDIDIDINVLVQRSHSRCNLSPQYNTSYPDAIRSNPLILLKLLCGRAVRFLAADLIADLGLDLLSRLLRVGLFLSSNKLTPVKQTSSRFASAMRAPFLLVLGFADEDWPRI